MKTIYVDISIRNDKEIFMVSRKIPLYSEAFGIMFGYYKAFYRMVKMLFPKEKYKLIID